MRRASYEHRSIQALETEDILAWTPHVATEAKAHGKYRKVVSDLYQRSSIALIRPDASVSLLLLLISLHSAELPVIREHQRT